MNMTPSLSKRLDQLKIPAAEKEMIVENGLRYRILELENKLRKLNSERKDCLTMPTMSCTTILWI